MPTATTYISYHRVRSIEIIKDDGKLPSDSRTAKIRIYDTEGNNIDLDLFGDSFRWEIKETRDG